MFVRESSDEQYIPDVFFTEKNEYGTEVKRTARPYFPVQYLFVTLESGGYVGEVGGKSKKERRRRRTTRKRGEEDRKTRRTEDEKR